MDTRRRAVVDSPIRNASHKFRTLQNSRQTLHANSREITNHASAHNKINGRKIFQFNVVGRFVIYKSVRLCRQSTAPDILQTDHRYLLYRGQVERVAHDQYCKSAD